MLARTGSELEIPLLTHNQSVWTRMSDVLWRRMSQQHCCPTNLVVGFLLDYGTWNSTDVARNEEGQSVGSVPQERNEIVYIHHDASHATP